MDVVESALIEAEMERFSDSSYKGGSGLEAKEKEGRNRTKNNINVEAYQEEFKIMDATGEFSWVNFSQAAFHVDAGCTHRPDKRRNDSKKAQSNKRTRTESDERACGRRRKNKSK